MLGQTLSHYRITARIGAGGMGAVYRAADTTPGGEVAPAQLQITFDCRSLLHAQDP